MTPKNIPNRERLIFAMDVADPQAARQLVEQLGDAVVFYKIGLELFMSGGYFELLDWMVARGKKVFVDLKFFDVPATVAAAVRQLSGRGVTFATIHGNQAIMEAAAAAKGDVKILAVTVLTSLDRGDLDDLGFTVDVEKLVLSRARRALEATRANLQSLISNLYSLASLAALLSRSRWAILSSYSSTLASSASLSSIDRQ